MGYAYKDITGRRHGKLTAITMVGKNNIGRALWLCKCDCGGEIVVSAQGLAGKTGTKSCGCLLAEVNKLRPVRNSTNLKHGESGGKSGRRSGEYVVWASMRQRCYNKSHSTYKDYGSRGIVVCKRWLDSYECFLQDMGRRPSSSHSLDRIDPNGNYEPENCRWVTWDVQANNKRKSISVVLFGKSMSIPEASRTSKVPQRTLHNWVRKLSYPFDITSFVELRNTYKSLRPSVN